MSFEFLHLGVLEEFAEAMKLGRRKTQKLVLGGGFRIPQQGKSGLSRPPRTPEERKEKRAELQRALRKKWMDDPEKAERIRAQRRERVRAWRARQKAQVAS